MRQCPPELPPSPNQMSARPDAASIRVFISRSKAWPVATEGSRSYLTCQIKRRLALTRGSAARVRESASSAPCARLLHAIIRATFVTSFPVTCSMFLNCGVLDCRKNFSVIKQFVLYP